MTTSQQHDSYQYKCKACHKLHPGPTLTFDFTCVQENTTDHGLERIHQADFSSAYECSENIRITFKVREHPEGIFDYLGYESADAEIIIPPKVREHTVIVW